EGETPAGGGPQDPMAQADPEAVQSFLAAAERAGLTSGEGPAADAELRPLADALVQVDPSAANLVAEHALLIEFSSSAGDDVDEMRQQLDEATAPLRELDLTTVAASDPILIDI